MTLETGYTYQVTWKLLENSHPGSYLDVTKQKLPYHRKQL
jgi:hypothetical protein